MTVLTPRQLLLAAAVLLVSACAPAPRASAPAPTTPPPTAAPPVAATANTYTPTPLNPHVPVRVTDDQVSSMVAIYLAYDRGYFTQEGLDVTLQVSNDRSQDVQLLATNQVDFIVSLPDPVLFNAIARNIDVKVIASATVNGPTDRPAAFLVRSDLLDSGRVKGPADLRGLNVAVGAPSATYYVQKYLERGGMTIDDVKVTMLPGPEALAAMSTKAIDAAWEAEPIATAMNTQGLARTVAVTGELVPGSVAGALAVSPQFAKTQPEAAQRFVNAFLRGARDYYSGFMLGNDPNAVVQSLITHTTVKDPKQYAQIGLPSYDPNCSTDPIPSWGAFQEYYVKRGIQEHTVDMAPYVDFSMIDHALDLMGRVQR